MRLIEQLREELAGLSEKLERKKKIETMLASLQAKETALARQVQSQGDLLAKENDDVERLERTTLTSVLLSILGRKDDRLSVEQQEALAARLKFEAAAGQLQDCRARYRELRSELILLAGCEEQYDRVYAQVLESLRADPVYAERVCSLEKQRGAVSRQIKELDEAITAGAAAQTQIGFVEHNLDKAEGWGTWDLMGGGMLADMAKHSRLDNAQAAAERLQVLLSRFHTELADVELNASFGSVNVDGFLRFADYFFDGLIADWSVLSRIHDSQQSVREAGWQIGNAMQKLVQLKKERLKEKETVEQQLAELVRRA